MLTEHGWTIVIVLSAIAFLILMDRGFSSFKLSVGT